MPPSLSVSLLDSELPEGRDGSPASPKHSPSTGGACHSSVVQPGLGCPSHLLQGLPSFHSTNGPYIISAAEPSALRFLFSLLCQWLQDCRTQGHRVPGSPALPLRGSQADLNEHMTSHRPWAQTTQVVQAGCKVGTAGFTASLTAAAGCETR